MADDKNKPGDPFVGQSNPLDAMGLLGGAPPAQLAVTPQVSEQLPQVETKPAPPAEEEVKPAVETEVAKQRPAISRRPGSRKKDAQTETEPAPAPEISGHQQLSCRIDALLMYKIDCILDHAPGMRKKVDFVEKALWKLVEAYEEEHGGPFPPPVNSGR